MKKEKKLWKKKKKVDMEVQMDEVDSHIWLFMRIGGSKYKNLRVFSLSKLPSTCTSCKWNAQLFNASKSDNRKLNKIL